MNKLLKDTKKYERLNFFNKNFGSVLICVLIIIITMGIHTYLSLLQNTYKIKSDWVNQRCSPSIIPFAGLINKPENMSASEFTQANFTYCTQNIISGIVGNALDPLTFIINILQELAAEIENTIQSIRAMFDKMRNLFQTITTEIMSRIVNFIIPLQEIIIRFRDLVGKIVGVITTSFFSLTILYYMVLSLVKIIANSIVSNLVLLSIMIGIMWLTPVTFGAASLFTTFFLLIAVPMSLILVFMTDVLQINTNLTIPTLKCFDKNTLIKMNNETYKKIMEIKVGETLYKNNQVTAVIKVETKGSKMYKLNNVIVSDTHIVNYKGSWIPVSKHPDAFLYKDIYNEPYLYCLNTTNKIIVIDKNVFTDWDEIYDESISKIFNNNAVQIEGLSNIHSCIDGGFCGLTKIKLKNNTYKNIQNVEIGDILKNGEKVYGLVEIDGENITNQFKYILGNSQIIEGGSNLVFYNNNIKNNNTKNKFSSLYLNNTSNAIKLKEKHQKLYHLLTDSKTFFINNIEFCDYNASIDLFLENTK